MDWFTQVIVPLVVGITPALLVYFGTRAQIKADLIKNQKELDKKSEENKKELDKKTAENQKEILDAIYSRNRQQDEALKSLLRSDILRLYFKHTDHKDPTLTQWESENLHKLYDSYCALGGNSFVKDVVDRMNGWEIVRN